MEGMMLKSNKSKLKLFGIITCGILFGISYVGISFYNVPEKVNAAETEVETRTLADITYMQEMNINICKNTIAKSLTQEFTLTDIRDKNKYTVKAATGDLCIMTKNLTLDLTNPAIPGTVHTFNIGISVSPSLPADTYSTEVTITAAAA